MKIRRIKLLIANGWFKTVCMVSYSLLSMFCSNASAQEIINQDNGSVTFWVDGELPNPKQYDAYIGRSVSTGQYVFKSSVEKDSLLFLEPVYGKSFLKSTPFFNGMVTAYSYHNPVVLSPDVIWLLISQGFSHYVNENSERLRSLFVDFNGRKTLTVQTGKNIFAPDMDWDAVTADFVKAVRSNLKHKDMADMMLADFSTSGLDEVIASRVTLMNTVEKYFEYKLEETICGIPYITLQGTPDDWKKIAAKVQQLRNYDMGWWADELEPIIQEFINASQGNPDREFWKCIVKKVRPGEVRGVGCLPMGDQTMFDGWFLKLMPFMEDGRTPDKVDLNARMLGEICGTDFTYSLLDVDGSEIGTIPMKLWGGLLGCTQDRKTTAISFKPGWMVSFNQNDVEKPQYPGGFEAMNKIIKDNIHITADMMQSNWQEPISCYIRLQFAPDGSFNIYSTYVLYGTETAHEEVRKATEKLSPWKPATINGIPVPYFDAYKISINVE